MIRAVKIGLVSITLVGMAAAVVRTFAGTASAGRERPVPRERLALGDPRILIPLARLGAAEGTPEEARTVVRSLRAVPLYGPLWLRAAASRIRAGDLPAARRCLESARACDPRNPVGHRLSATVAFLDGDYAAFRREAIAGLAIAPMPDFLRLPWKPGDALPAFLEAMRERRSLYARQEVEVAVRIGEQLAHAGRDEEALAEIESVRPQAGFASWRLVQLEAGIRAKTSKRAAADLLDRALAGPSLLLDHAAMLSEQRALVLASDPASDPARTRAAVEDALGRSPAAQAPMLAYARYLAARQSSAEAVVWARRAAVAGSERATSWTAAADVAATAGDLLAELEFLKRAVALDSGADSSVRLVNAAFASSQNAEAEEVLVSALRRFPSDPRLVRLGDALREAAIPEAPAAAPGTPGPAAPSGR